MSLGNKIKELREKMGKTQLDVSKFLGVTYQTIYKYEKDIAVPPADAIIKLAEYFNVTTDYLLGRTNDSASNIDKRLQENKIKASASSDIDLAKYAQLDEDKKKFVDKQMNAMIDMFLEEKNKKD